MSENVENEVTAEAEAPVKFDQIVMEYPDGTSDVLNFPEGSIAIMEKQAALLGIPVDELLREILSEGLQMAEDNESTLPEG